MKEFNQSEINLNYSKSSTLKVEQKKVEQYIQFNLESAKKLSIQGEHKSSTYCIMRAVSANFLNQCNYIKSFQTGIAGNFVQIFLEEAKYIHTISIFKEKNKLYLEGLTPKGRKIMGEVCFISNRCEIDIPQI